MTKHIALGLAVLASVSMLPLIAAAQDKDSGGFDVSEPAPAAAAEAESSATASVPVSSNQVTVGVGGVTQSNAVFGRYNGMPQAGAGGLVSWNVVRRDAWDSGGTHYFTSTASNLNFGFGETAPEANISLKMGEQGKWWVSGVYDAMTYTATDDFHTLLDRQGDLAPGFLSALVNAGAFVSNLPITTANATGNPLKYVTSTNGNLPGKSFFPAIKTPSASTGIASGAPSFPASSVAAYGGSTSGNELVYDIGTRRDKGTLSGGFEFGDWLITAGVSHEHKEGSLEQTMTTAGNNAGMMAFAMPINYDTDVFNISGAFNTEKFQAVLSYEFSNFRDNNSGGFAFQGWNFTEVRTPAALPSASNSTGLTGTTNYTYNAYELSGVYSLPPSNQAHTVTAELGYNLTQTTRLNLTGVYGLQLQNDPFGAPTGNLYTLNAAASDFAKNPSSLNGSVQTWFANAAVTSRPINKLDIKASYTLDARDPQTNPMWIYGDPTDAVDSPSGLKYREAVPESWTKQQFAVTAGYHILQDTRLTVGYTFRDAERANAITHHTQDNEESVKLQSTFLGGMTASLGYLHADRTASAPDWSLWNVQINSDCGSSLTNSLGCQQVPFYEAARTQDAVTGMFTAQFGSKVAFSVYGKWNDDQYHDPNTTYLATAANGITMSPSVGVNRDYSIQAAPDLSWQPDKLTDVHLFYTFLRTYRAMRALNNQSDPGAGYYYSEATTYDIQTAGLSLSRQVTQKLKLGAEYIYSYGNLGFNQAGAWSLSQGLAGDPHLSENSIDNQVKIHATYAYSPNLSLYLSYRFDSLDYADWALVGASAYQVLTGDLPPHYNVSTIIGAVSYKF